MNPKEKERHLEVILEKFEVVFDELHLIRNF